MCIRDSFANVLHYCGEQVEAIRHINLAMRYQPLYPLLFINILASAYCVNETFEDAETTTRQAIQLSPSDIHSRLVLARALLKLERDEALKTVVSEVVEINLAFSIKRFMEAQFYKDAEYISEVSNDLLSAGLPA